MPGVGVQHQSACTLHAHTTQERRRGRRPRGRHTDHRRQTQASNPLGAERAGRARRGRVAHSSSTTTSTAESWLELASSPLCPQLRVTALRRANARRALQRKQQRFSMQPRALARIAVRAPHSILILLSLGFTPVMWLTVHDSNKRG